MNLDAFLCDVVEPKRCAIDRSPRAMGPIVRQLVEYLFKGASINHAVLNRKLRKIYRHSGALGFLFHQHLAAVEKLMKTPGWRQRNTDLFERIRKGKTLVGLATTHLAFEGRPRVTSRRTQEGYLVSGAVGWASGYGIFEKLILGFWSDDQEVAFLDVVLQPSGVKALKIESI